MARRDIYVSAFDEARDAHDRYVDPVEYRDLGPEYRIELPGPRRAPAAENVPTGLDPAFDADGRCEEPMWMGASCGAPADESGFCDEHREVLDPDLARDLRTGR